MFILWKESPEMIDCHNFRPSKGKPIVANTIATASNTSKGKQTWVFTGQEGYIFQKRRFLLKDINMVFIFFSVGQGRTYESYNWFSAK